MLDAYVRQRTDTRLIQWQKLRRIKMQCKNAYRGRNHVKQKAKM